MAFRVDLQHGVQYTDRQTDRHDQSHSLSHTHTSCLLPNTDLVRSNLAPCRDNFKNRTSLVQQSCVLVQGLSQFRIGRGSVSIHLFSILSPHPPSQQERSERNSLPRDLGPPPILLRRRLWKDELRLSGSRLLGLYLSLSSASPSPST